MFETITSPEYQRLTDVEKRDIIKYRVREIRNREEAEPGGDAPELPDISDLLDEPQSENIQPGWQAFPENSGSLNIPRVSMPQIKSEHRGALVQYLRGRGITHSQEEIAPNTLKPSQSEFSAEKVAKARNYEGGQRSILVSSDGYVLDGHH